MRKIRTAVVGLNMGLQHAYAYDKAERADLRWVVDLDENRAAQVAEELGCGYATDWTKIVDDVDAVSICTPHHLHAPQSLQAIAAGKHVLLEKPIANTLEDCWKIIHAAEDKGVTFMMAYIVRFLPAVQRLKEAIDREEFGRAFNANCWIEGYMPPAPGSWFSRKEQLGGGVLFSHGCHYIDLLIWLLGNTVNVASLGTQLGTEWMEGEGTAHSVMKFESGALGYLETSWGMKYAYRPDLLHVHTKDALLMLDASVSKLDVMDASGRRTLIAPVEGETAGFNTQGEIEHFLDCIETGRTPDTDGYAAMKSHQAIWAMYEEQNRVQNYPGNSSLGSEVSGG
ncbi:Gfo/Idh/MocA family protein [Paenibacillus mendelii]|uniref:Gfo/Idh/MocA family protein n=1 Tax=Paenibacillus mendelii TaxID=206163 RepID=A0ABV6JKS1_9BACL|nr:Gfo/Idh/MocA family oxidoreductase [Paenibacillus mendelii]MCQ6560643.1 Gfo/Idh/MocA family oxidoreductase [Paenibacillus mendelii]